jgi:hypothetical protein
MTSEPAKTGLSRSPAISGPVLGPRDITPDQTNLELHGSSRSPDRSNALLTSPPNLPTASPAYDWAG